MSSLVARRSPEDKSYLRLIDEASTTLFYIGAAELGTLSSGSQWRIQRIQQVGNVWEIKWADGNDSFDNVWDDRTSLTYS